MNKDKCYVCGEKIDFSKVYVNEDVTEWKNDVGKSTERDYHKICFLRSRR